MCLNAPVVKPDENNIELMEVEQGIHAFPDNSEVVVQFS